MFTNPQRMSDPETKRLREDGGLWLRESRERQGVSQRDLAAATHFKYYTQVAHIEAGVGRIPADRHHLWAAALGMDEQTFVRKVMRYYDPATFWQLFDESEIEEAALIASKPMRKPLDVPEFNAEDAKALREEAGRWLQSLRECRGIVQLDLANLLGFKFYTRVSQIERGVGRVPPELYKQYAEALRVDAKPFVKSLLRLYDPVTYYLAFRDEIEREQSVFATSP